MRTPASPQRDSGGPRRDSGPTVRAWGGFSEAAGCAPLTLDQPCHLPQRGLPSPLSSVWSPTSEPPSPSPLSSFQVGGKGAFPNWRPDPLLVPGWVGDSIHSGTATLKAHHEDEAGAQHHSSRTPARLPDPADCSDPRPRTAQSPCSGSDPRLSAPGGQVCVRLIWAGARQACQCLPMKGPALSLCRLQAPESQSRPQRSCQALT